jgi:zinc D-Ala-D-Ala dipeptidase
VDLSLYDLKTGEEVKMPSGYDEMSNRSFADYVGGTADERARRALLRQAMEKQGFTVYPQEWWHFDYKDWKQYPILNVKFEDLGQ